MKPKKGLIVIPACNEARSLECFLPKVKGVISNLGGFKANILVISDGSKDETKKVVRRAGCQLKSHRYNRGLGVSLREGYHSAATGGYDFLVTMDADGQHDPQLLPLVLDRLFTGGIDLVTASRYHPQSQRMLPPLDRDLLNVAFTAIIHSVTGWHHLTDPLTGFWGMKRWVAEFLAQNLKLERYGTCLEGLVKLWYLCQPRPVLAEIPHPAIYAGANGGLLTRDYSPANLEQRLERFGVHALHVLEALQDVIAQGGEVSVDKQIRLWRSALLSEKR